MGNDTSASAVRLNTEVISRVVSFMLRLAGLIPRYIFLFNFIQV